MNFDCLNQTRFVFYFIFYFIFVWLGYGQPLGVSGGMWSSGFILFLMNFGSWN